MEGCEKIIQRHKLNLIKNQINYYKEKLINEIFDTYFLDTNIDISEFKYKILKKRRHQKIKKIEEETISKNQCCYVLWNKGNLRQCKNNKIEDSSYCFQHQNSENMFKDC